MTLWVAVVAASLACLALKLAGHYVPRRWLGNPRFRRISALLPVALLAALVAVQTLGDGPAVRVDARLPALLVAAALLLARAPFIAVVAAAAATAATWRLFLT